MLQSYFYICAWSASVLYFTVPAYLCREYDKSVIMLFGMFHNQSVWHKEATSHILKLLKFTLVIRLYILNIYLHCSLTNLPLILYTCYFANYTLQPESRQISCTDSRNRNLSKRNWLRDDRANEPAKKIKCRVKQFDASCQGIVCISKVTPNTTCCLQSLLYFENYSDFFLSIKVFHSF